MQIEVFGDTVCPWCRIGKRHLELALEQWDGEPVDVVYRAFFLNEGMPDEGANYHEYMKEKLQGRVPMDQLYSRPTQAGEAVGLEFNFDKIQRSPNTRKSHQLVSLASDEKKKEVLDAIYDAYFQHGKDIGDISMLARIGEDAGLDRVAASLLAGEGLEVVVGDIQQAREYGVSSVPLFVFDEKFAIAGAHPPDVLLSAMRHAIEQRQAAGAAVD